MKKFLFISIILIVFLWTDVQGQSVGISPASHRFWGETVGMTEFYAEYKFLGVHYFYNRDERLYSLEGSNEIISQTSSFAFSVTPLDVKYFRAGLIMFERRFPVTVASKVHFLLEASLPLRRFTISYRHISNGFGVFNEINPGVDSFSVKYRF